ncbi:hypothetical protein GJAV_G00005110 [Gymnothorax javanicus]|nr:hypothetical protein GJAV_G00005110 [Gymnothorax javanicus]
MSEFRCTLYVFMYFFDFLGTKANVNWYSYRCRKNLATYWNPQLMRCELCEMKFKKYAGYQFSPNCGMQDDGGQPAPAYEPCENGSTFNNGSFISCRKCKLCLPGQLTLASCNITTDTQCCEKGIFFQEECRTPDATKLTPTVEMLTESTTRFMNIEPTSESKNHCSWIAVVPVLSTVCLLLLIYKNKKVKCCRKGDPSEGECKVKVNTNILPPQRNKKVDELLATHIQEAPLQTVLDNLDVLEDLIMLLDPDNSMAKTTRHVATHCSFSAMWINYAYSMRDIKSPLKAVLEAVTTKSPEWTVGHLAKVFNEIGRNDAVAVLAKLPILKENLCYSLQNLNDV